MMLQDIYIGTDFHYRDTPGKKPGLPGSKLAFMQGEKAFSKQDYPTREQTLEAAKKWAELNSPSQFVYITETEPWRGKPGSFYVKLFRKGMDTSDHIQVIETTLQTHRQGGWFPRRKVYKFTI